MLDDEASSLLLFHHRDTGLVLIVTGLLPPDSPLDFQSRTIRAALLGRAMQADDFGDIVGMAALGLREQIARRLPLSWTEATKLGFRIDRGRWADLLQTARDIAGEPHGASAGFIRLDTEAEREAAADRLIGRYQDRGDLSGRIIVLRTSRLDASQFQDLNPWLGLTTDPDIRRLGQKPQGTGPSIPPELVQLGIDLGTLAWKTIWQARRHPLGVLLVVIVLAGIGAGTYVAVRPGAPAQPKPSVTATATATSSTASTQPSGRASPSP
jgi:hypothetical protein